MPSPFYGEYFCVYMIITVSNDKYLKTVFVKRNPYQQSYSYVCFLSLGVRRKFEDCMVKLFSKVIFFHFICVVVFYFWCQIGQSDKHIFNV